MLYMYVCVCILSYEALSVMLVKIQLVGLINGTIVSGNVLGNLVGSKQDSFGTT